MVCLIGVTGQIKNNQNTKYYHYTPPRRKTRWMGSEVWHLKITSTSSSLGSCFLPSTLDFLLVSRSGAKMVDVGSDLLSLPKFSKSNNLKPQVQNPLFTTMNSKRLRKPKYCFCNTLDSETWPNPNLRAAKPHLNKCKVTLKSLSHLVWTCFTAEKLM